MTAVQQAPLIREGDMTFTPWISEDAIRARVAEIASYLGARFEGQHVRIIPILRGAKEFGDMLVDEIGKCSKGPQTLDIDPIRVKSYAGTSSRQLRWLKEPQQVAKPGVHDILVEDIADSARTLTTVEAYFGAQNPASLTTVVLLDRPAARAEGIVYSPEIVGFRIDNPAAWAIGFGLDLDEAYRDLPLIYGKLGPNGETPPPYQVPDLPAIN